MEAVMTDIRICPVCGEKLNSSPRGLACSRGHSFDRAKEGYVNLLGGSKKGYAPWNFERFFASNPECVKRKIGPDPKLFIKGYAR